MTLKQDLLLNLLKLNFEYYSWFIKRNRTHILLNSIVFGNIPAEAINKYKLIYNGSDSYIAVPPLVPLIRVKSIQPGKQASSDIDIYLEGIPSKKNNYTNYLYSFKASMYGTTWFLEKDKSFEQDWLEPAQPKIRPNELYGY